MNKNKFLKIFGSVFLTVGIVFGSRGVKILQDSRQFLAESQAATGTVTSLDKRSSMVRRSGSRRTSVLYFPVVEFQTGKSKIISFHGNFGSSPPAYSVGDKVKVLYKPDDPESAKINSYFSLWGEVSIFLCFGLMFSGVGFRILIFVIKKQNAVSRIKKFGYEVLAEVQGVYLDGSFKVNGKSPWVVSCQWHNQSTNKVYTFRSEQYWFDPSSYIEKGALVKVKFDLRRPSVHWVYLDGVLPDAA